MKEEPKKGFSEATRSLTLPLTNFFVNDYDFKSFQFSDW